jgi:hypothetical protein
MLIAAARKNSKITRALLLAATPLAMSLTASAADYNIQNAAGVYFTPKGEQFFQTNLVDVLKTRGIDLSHREMKEVPFGAPGAPLGPTTPLSLANLPPAYQKFRSTLAQARDLIKDWLIGFELKDPKVTGKASDLKYTATFKELSVRADRDLSKDRTDGVIFVLEVVVPQFRFDVAKFVAKDEANTILNNPAFGGVGAKKIFLELKDDGHPFKLQAPLRVNVKPDGTMELQALSVTTNFATLNLRSGFQLVWPKIQMKLGTQVSTLDTSDVDAKIHRLEQGLIKTLQKYLDNEVQTRLPTELNGLMAAEAAKGFSMPGTIGAPGSPVDPTTQISTQPMLNYSMRPSGLSIGEGGLQLQLGGYVEDPTVDFDSSPILGVEPKPRLGFVEPANYDFALSVNQTFVNQILKLSYDRGNFDAVDAGGSSMTLTQAPFFWPGPTDGSGRLRIVVKHDTSGLKEDLFLEGPVEVEAEMDVTFLVQPDNQMSVLLKNIDEDSFTIEDRFIRFTSLTGQVRSAIKDQIHDKNTALAGKKVLAQGIQVPQNLLGIPINLLAVNLDPNGHLVFYMEFKR